VEDKKALGAALFYASRGWPVFPCYEIKDGVCSCGNPKCASPGKHPRVPHGVKDASFDPAVIREWWKRWPDANVAVATGKLVVIDIDTRHDGEIGWDLLTEGRQIPETLTVGTGGGGRHYYFRCPEGVTLAHQLKLVAVRAAQLKTEQGGQNVQGVHPAQ